MAQKFSVGFFGGYSLVQGFYWVLFEVLGICLGFGVLPPFDDLCHLKSREPPWGLNTSILKVNRYLSD